jgi:hypothetical protein
VSFLYPLLWLGALGAAVPLWLHLRRKQPSSVTPFSALRFLDDLPRPRRGSLRLRDPLLLALRLLALLLVVAAFAWPYVREAAPVVTASRVHVLDATLSQQATLSQRTAAGFDADRQAVLRALEASPASVQNAVVTLAHESAVAVGFADDRASALARLRELAPSHQRGSYLEAFRLASSLLDQSLGLEKEIVVHGDFQSNQWSEHQTSPPFLRGVEVVLAGEPVGAALPNLALHEPRSRFSFLGDQTFVDMTLDLAHQGPMETARVVVTAGGKTVLEGDFALTPPASTLTLRARWQTDPARWVRGHAEVAGAPDALAADDRVYFCIPPVREGRLALLARSPFLHAALAPDVMRGRWTTETLDPVALDPGALLAELADVLVAEASYVQSEKARELIFRYLNNERGVVLLLDRATPLVKGFLRELGLEAVEAEAAASQTFRYFNVFHPIFQPFVDGELGDLTTPRVHDHVRLRSAVARPLIYGHVGGALMVEGVSTKGRLLVFTFGFRLDQTDWPIQPSFLPFLDLTLQYARAATPLETSWTPGDLYALELPDDRAVTSVVVAREDAEDDTGTLRLPAADAGSVRFRVPDAPGVYRVSLDDDAEPYVLLAVNPAPDESRLVYDAEPAALAAWTLPAPATPSPSPLAAGLVPRSEALAQKLWWWLALAGLFALAGESLRLGWRRDAGRRETA